MNTKKIKSLSRWLGLALLSLLLLAAVVPYLIPVSPLDGLSPPQALAEPESQFVTIPFAGTDGIDLHYLEQGATGAETTFVLLHGSVFNAFTWNETMSFFAQQGRVIAYDQIPYGLSEKLLPDDWSGADPYTADAAVQQLLSLLDTLEIESAVLVGNSYGAVLAVEAARRYPDRVNGLILADAAVYVSESVPAWAVELPQVQRLGPLFGRMIGNSEAFVRQTYADPDLIDAERMRLTLIHTEAARWDEAMWAYLQAWGTQPLDVTAELAAISQPALVLTGDTDAVVPVADSERLAAALPDAEYVLLPSCGHVPQEECPRQFGDAVAAWLPGLGR